MTLVNEQLQDLNGRNLHIIDTNQFKTNAYVLHFRSPITKDSVTKKALLSYVLKNACEKYPTLRDLQSKLDELYGASLHAQLSKKGNEHVLTLVMTCANDHYLKTESGLLKETLDLFSNVVFRPFKGGSHQFNEDLVTRQKRSLKQFITAMYDNKSHVASERMVDEMFADDNYRHHTYGYVDELDKITPEDLYSYYESMLKNDSVDFYIIGDVDKEEVYRLAEERFPFAAGNVHGEDKQTTQKKKGSINEVVDTDDVEQAKLAIGFRTDATAGTSSYYAAQVFNGLFGGFPHSKLFKNVREKHSLAYSVASRYESYKGFLMVMAGVAFENIDKTISIIKDEFKHMQQGKFTDAEMEQTKKLLKSRILESIDSPIGLSETLYRSELFPEPTTIQAILDGLEAVNKQDIMDAGKHMHLDTVYCLKGNSKGA